MKRLILVMLLSVGWWNIAEAITRADATPPFYQEPVIRTLSPWAGVKNLRMDHGSCTATFITRKHILTAGHCFFKSSDGAGEQVTADEVRSFDISKIELHGKYDKKVGHRQGGHDIAVLTLKKPVTTATFNVYNNKRIIQDERSHGEGLAVKVGYGRSGNGTNGAAGPPNQKRFMENRIDAFGTGGTGEKDFWYNTRFKQFKINPPAGTFLYDFDNPNLEVDQQGKATNLVNQKSGKNDAVGSKEGSPAGGDSGGPMFQTKGDVPVLVGVTSSALSSWHRKMTQRPHNFLAAGYGEIAFDTRVQDHYDFIEAARAQELKANIGGGTGKNIPKVTAPKSKEYSDSPDTKGPGQQQKSAPSSDDSDQVLRWDGAGNVFDAYDFAETRAEGLPLEAEVDALANVQDSLFFDVTNNQAAALFSIAPSEGSGHFDSQVEIWAERPSSEIEPWAYKTQINKHGVNNLDALEIWGAPGLEDANLYSLANDPFGIAVWAYEPESNASLHYIWGDEIQSALMGADLMPALPGNAMDIGLDVDALMVYDMAQNNIWEPGDWILFSLEQLWISLDSQITELFAGDEIFVWQNGGSIDFLDHGGHLWDSNWLGRDIDAFEAAAVAEPRTLALLSLGALALILGRKYQGRRQDRYDRAPNTVHCADQIVLIV
jgi:hypothetical protein